MDEWLDEAAAALGEGPVSGPEVGGMLRLAREVAHGVERRLAPLSTYLVGLHVGRLVAEGMTRQEALGSALDVLRPLIPEPAPDGDQGS